MRHSSCFMLKFLLKGIAALILIDTVFLLSCKVVKLTKDKSEKGYTIYFENENFDADKIVNELWDSKVIPYVTVKARDVTTVVDEIFKNKENAGMQYGAREKEEGAAWNFIVFGEAIIKALDSTSRAGKLLIDIQSIKNSEITIQTGPVLKGTSLRDSFDFLSFDQFTNQIEFASVSTSLNKRVLDLLKDAQLNNHIGKKLKFYGTFTMPDDVSKISVTPVILEIL